MKSEIFVDKWFSNPIWETQLSLDNLELSNWAYSLQKSYPGVYKSNKGGWQCAELADPPDSYTSLKEAVNDILVDVHSSMGLKQEYKSFITESWLNINPPQSYNAKHLHPRSLFSGVYYISVPEGDCGNIIFERDPLMLSYLPSYIVKDWNDMTSGTTFYVPKEGKLLIFPSWLLHWVETNNTQNDRISLSFNTNYDF
jgi:uncharacterized protein (TIGR02466 family)